MPYKTIRIGFTKEDTEDMLNDLEKEGWKLICSYALAGSYLILYKEKK